MAARKGKEFFEAFKGSGVPGQPPPAPSPSQPRSVLPTPSFKVIPPRSTFTPSQPATVTFTQTRLIVMGGGVGVLVIVAFLLGVVIGGHSSAPNAPRSYRQPAVTNRVVAPPATDATDDTRGGTTGTISPEPVWRLQLISGITADSTQELVTWLKEQGYDAASDKSKRGVWTVYVGEFADKDSREAAQFQETFRSMEYQGKKQFSSCLFVTK